MASITESLRNMFKIQELRERISFDQRQMRMQTRFMVYFGAVVLTLMTTVILLMETRQSTTMLRQTEARGAAVANSIASVVIQSLYEYDYVYLQQAAEMNPDGDTREEIDRLADDIRTRR